MIEAGKVLQNRYRVQRQIGQGGMGAVYIATDERFGSTVAVKETLVLEEQYRKAIEREARLLNSLKHPALPRVTDHFTDEDGQFIVMEFIPGSDLSEMMEQNGRPFPAEQVLDWADQLLDALDFLHTQEMPVIHRDIKPQNLKLTPQGRIILLDFGLAKGNPTDAEHQTAAKSIFGYSRSYASLEQIQGTGTDPRSDLYSLAATLYHLLTGIPPEDALTRAMHVLSDRGDTLKNANALNSQIPAGVAGVLRRALALNSNQRPESAEEMRQMLRESERYAVSSETATLIGNPTQAVYAAQNTTPESFNNQTDIQTKIFEAEGPRGHQVEIPVHNGTEAPKFASSTQVYTDAPRRRSWAGPVAVIGLLFAGIAASGLFFLKSDAFSSNQNPSQVVGQNSPAANAADNKVVTAAVNANTLSNTTPAAAPTAKSTPKNETAAANTRNSRADQPAGAGKSSTQPDIRVDGETVYIGNTKITDDRLETPDTIIDENGVHPKNQKNPQNPPRPPRIVLPPEVFRQMTPDQRRRFRIDMNKLNKLNKRSQTPPVDEDNEDN